MDTIQRRDHNPFCAFYKMVSAFAKDLDEYPGGAEGRCRVRNVVGVIVAFSGSHRRFPIVTRGVLVLY